MQESGRYAEAIPEFEKGLELKPKYYTIYYNLGRTLLAAGRPDKEIRTLEKGLQYYESRHLYTELGLALASKRRIEEAKAQFDKALGINPNDAIAHFARGMALAYKSDWDAAITEYRETLRLNPQNESAHIYLGAALRQKGDSDGEIAEYRKALRLNPNDADAHCLLGFALEHKRNSAEALQQYRAAYQLDPHDPEYRKAYERLLGKTHI